MILDSAIISVLNEESYLTAMSIEVGDYVWDDLTSQNAQIVKITQDSNGNIGIWLDNDYMDGGRFQWEISFKK